MNRKTEIFGSKSELVKAVADRIVLVASEAIGERNVCSIALAGGNTPRDVYALLSSDSYKDRVDWEQVQLFWGDERTVPPDHSDSNFRMAREAFIDRIEIPDENVHRMRGEIKPAQGAAEYMRTLQQKFPETPPRFDLILLGLGEDGHTASLFPETTALDENDQSVTAVFVPKFNTWRITLTLSVLNAARNVVFIVSGESKSKIVYEVLNVKQATKDLPATMVQPENGNLFWMLDAEAAVPVEE